MLLEHQYSASCGRIQVASGVGSYLCEAQTADARAGCCSSYQPQVSQKCPSLQHSRESKHHGVLNALEKKPWMRMTQSEQVLRIRRRGLGEYVHLAQQFPEDLMPVTMRCNGSKQMWGVNLDANHRSARERRLRSLRGMKSASYEVNWDMKYPAEVEVEAEVEGLSLSTQQHRGDDIDSLLRTEGQVHN